MVYLEIKKYAVADMISGADIKKLRGKLKLTQAEFAALVNVSQKTVERWESTDSPVTGPVVTLVKILCEHPQLEEELKIVPKEYPLRLWYMCGDDVCTIIDVDEQDRRVKIKNYTGDYMFRAFGRQESPSFEDYEAFLESRCFPRGRDKMKLVLEELKLPFYDPFMIIEKTEGRMAEDDFWIGIER